MKKYCGLLRRQGEKHWHHTACTRPFKYSLEHLCPFPTGSKLLITSLSLQFPIPKHLGGHPLAPTACPVSGSSTFSHHFSPAQQFLTFILTPAQDTYVVCQLNNAVCNSWTWVFNQINSWMICTRQREGENSQHSLWKKSHSEEKRKITYTHFFVQKH